MKTKPNRPTMPAASRARNNFFTGLAVVLPIALSVAVFIWIFKTVAGFTDMLLFFLPKGTIHVKGDSGPVLWYWSAVAFGLAGAIIIVAGALTRYYVGKKLIQLTEAVINAIPILNTIYGAFKQINQAFASDRSHSFQQVVLVEFPRPGIWSIGFMTGDEHPEVELRLEKDIISVFVPTTPNPTTGFLCLLPKHDVTILDMTVADGIKYIMSLGAVAPGYTPPEKLPRKNG
jgi:uncharacterized membrane protein